MAVLVNNHNWLKSRVKGTAGAFLQLKQTDQELIFNYRSREHLENTAKQNIKA